MNARKSRAEAAAVKVAAMRAEQARADRRRKLIAWGGVALVLVLVAALVVAKLAGVGTAKAAKTTAATTTLTSTLASAAAGLESLGAGTAANPPTAIKATALTSAGKPRIMYVGAEYCPFCAAQRWAVAVALSRFGTWSGLGQTTSAAGDVYPNTPTLSFHGAQLTSSYVTFTGVETTTNQPLTGGGYQPLDTLSAADTALVKKYNAAPYVAASSAGSIPFIDIGGAYISSGASYTPQLLSGKTQAQVAGALKVPTDPIAQAVGGAANLLTAAICKTTNNQPAAVCTASGVTAAATKLGHGS